MGTSNQPESKGMSLNRIGIEDNELMMQIEDLPSYNFNNLSDVLTSTKKLSDKRVAIDFIHSLESALKYKKLEELNFVYDYAFNKLSNEYFEKKIWPEAHVLEQEDEDFDIDMLTLNLYQELTYRHVYARLQLDADIRKNSWDNYMDLFT